MSDGSPDAAFEALVGSVDPAMWIVTAAADGERSGCLVGFATQASIRPPRLLVCMSEVNHTFAVAMAADVLAVHLLRYGDHALAERFGGESGDDIDKFDGLEVREGPDGVPVLPLLDHVIGRVVDRLGCGDHVAVLLAPEGGRVTRTGVAPLRLRDVADVDPAHPA